MNEAEDDDVDVYDTASHADRTYMPYDSTRDADESASLNQNKANRKAVGVSVVILSTTHQGLDLLLGYHDTAEVLEWNNRAIWLCSFSGTGAEGSMVTVSLTFVVIPLIGHDAGSPFQRFLRAGSQILGEYGRRIPMPKNLKCLHLHGKLRRKGKN